MKLKKTVKRGVCAAMRCKEAATVDCNGVWLCARHAAEYAEETGEVLPAPPGPLATWAPPETEASDLARESKELFGLLEEQVGLLPAKVVAEFLSEVKNRYSQVDAKKRSITRPLNDALEATRALFHPALDALKSAEVVLKKRLSVLHAEEQREKRRQLEAAQAGVDTGNEAAVKAALETMAKVQGSSDVPGVSYSTVWKFEVTDPAAVPREFCSPDERLIRAVVRQRKGETAIPGVKVWEDTRVSGRRK